jgi:hypothetical protein
MPAADRGAKEIFEFRAHGELAMGLHRGGSQDGRQNERRKQDKIYAGDVSLV